MATVKTAISLDEGLYDRVDELARELGVPRSQIFALAVEDFLRRRDSRLLLKAIDAATEVEPTPEEQELLRRARRYQRRLVEGEW